MYSRLRSKHGAEAARLYGAANEQALAWIADRVAARRDRLRLPAPRSAYVYSSQALRRRGRGRRGGRGRPAGDVRRADAAAVSGRGRRALRPTRPSSTRTSTCSALAAQLPEVYEHTHAVQVGDAVRTPGRRGARAEHTIVATHFPFPDRSLAFARVHPQRSYAIACRIAGAPPEGMFISGDSPTRSVRAVPVGDEELLIVGGEGHKHRHGRRHRGALRAPGGLRARALGRALGRVPLVGAGQHDRRRPAVRRAA